MGSERKSRKRRSPSDEEDDMEKNKKHRKREEKERRRKDQDKERKKRKRDEKSRDHSDKKSREKHKHSNKRSDTGFKELSDDDYFSKNNEFSTWLKDEKGIYFSELSSEAARDLFSSFIKAWNKQKLQPRYYDGIASAPRSAHNWNIKNEK